MARKMKIPGWPEALTPQIPGIPGIPGLPNPLDNPLTNTLTGGFDFVKNLWGGLPATVPGFVVPTVDIEELDKRIKDLKAVEAWLEVNGHMLRATIQSLEVQRNTVAAIKAIGGSLGGTAADLFRNLPPAAPQAEAQTATSNPFRVPAYAYSAAPDKEPEPHREEAPAPKTARTAATKPAAGDLAAPGLSATAWLGFLQDQFNNVALAALAGSDAAAGKPTSRTTTKAVSKAAVSKAAASKRAKSAAKTARKR